MSLELESRQGENGDNLLLFDEGGSGSSRAFGGRGW